MQSAQLNKEFNEKSRCSECNIRSYSFCRCLQEDKLKEFSNISSEKKFQNKANIFLQQDDAKNIYNITAILISHTIPFLYIIPRTLCAAPSPESLLLAWDHLVMFLPLSDDNISDLLV